MTLPFMTMHKAIPRTRNKSRPDKAAQSWTSAQTDGWGSCKYERQTEDAANWTAMSGCLTRGCERPPGCSGAPVSGVHYWAPWINVLMPLLLFKVVFLSFAVFVCASQPPRSLAYRSATTLGYTFAWLGWIKGGTRGRSYGYSNICQWTMFTPHMADLTCFT